ncbi:hypothetical protein FHP23_010550 [Bacillus cereus]|uniref:hypothetical protein n=1 Tax=Bacillus cereus TaxID=1396 RepID=UPI00111EC236|nr:hypothetical protein [Bacillus cereus]UDW08393.1 hypothetical protein FHP23_010550 [Bacillus cereus]
MVKTIKEKDIDEVEEYLSKFENILSDYIGNKVSLPIEDISESGEITIGLRLGGLVQYPYIEEFADLLGIKIVNLLEESINKTESLDWEIFHKLKLKLSLSFIFGELNDTKVDFSRVEFLNDLIEISSRTYESTPANIGILYCEECSLEKLEQYNIDIIKLQNNSKIKDFFEKEKPFLRLVDGESVNLLMNNKFEVYGIVRSNKEELDLSKEIIKQFENYKLKRNLSAVKEYFVGIIDEQIVNGSGILKEHIVETIGDHSVKGDEILKAIFGLVKKGISKANIDIECTEPQFIYFRAENAKVNVYNKEDFNISFEKGDWKLRNFHLLQYIILQYSLLRTHVFVGLEKNPAQSNIIKNAFKCIEILIENITFLSKNKISSIIMFASNRGENDQWNASLTEKEAIEILESAPLKKSDSKKMYLELIKRNGHHLNIAEVNSKFLGNLCAIDGALVLDDIFNILSFGEIIDVAVQKHDANIYGTGTNACKVASEKDLAIKVSEDGDIKVYLMGKNLLTI